MLKKTIVFLSLMVAFLLPSPLALASGENIFNDACKYDPGSAVCQNTKPREMKDVAKDGLGILNWVAGVVALFIILYAAYLITRSGGNADLVVKGKRAIVFAVVGLIVVIAANAIVMFVLNLI